MALTHNFFKTLIGLTLAGSLAAQVGTGTLTGRIVDGTNAAIPEAEVKVVNVDSGTSLDLRSNGEGIYRAAALVPGTYQLEIRAAGFEAVVRKNVILAVAQTLAADFVLQLGQQ